MVGLVSFAVFHPLPAAIVTAVVLAAGLALFVLLAARIRRGWQRRRADRLRRRSSVDRGTVTPLPQR